MKILVNDKTMVIPEGSSLAQLSNLIELPTRGIAVAVNNSLIPRKDWVSYDLKNNDKIIIIKAACGG